MKGYVVLFCLVVCIVWLMPTAFADVSDAVPTDAPTVGLYDILTVELTEDPTVTETVKADELVLWETAACVPPDTPKEAIKATAVACYTAFCYQQDALSPIRTTLPYPEAYNEAYWTAKWGEQAQAYLQVYRSALEAVRGQRLTLEDRPIMAVFHAMNTGKTEDASVLWGEELPYLRSVASPADALQVDLHTTVSLPVAEAEPILKTLCGTDTLPEQNAWFCEAERTEAGTVKTVTVCGKALEGRQVRDAFSLPSAAFEVQIQDGQVLFTVSGSGHFVGMSLCGAAAMAADGATYETILKHYYTGATLA